jgi:hypothetical protein
MTLMIPSERHRKSIIVSPQKPSHTLTHFLLSKAPQLSMSTFMYLVVLTILTYFSPLPTNFPPHSILCVFHGYSSDHKGYPCLDLSFNHIVVTHSIDVLMIMNFR